VVSRSLRESIHRRVRAIDTNPHLDRSRADWE